MNQTTTIIYLAFFVVMIVFLFYLPSRKQKQERQRLMAAIKPKAKVTTIGGILGTITKIKEDTVIIKIANNVEIEILKSAIRNAEGGKDVAEKKQKEESEETVNDVEDVVEPEVK
ncbi:preprotein translocase subunit YajC [Dehalobacter sp. DCM]|uniref:preprotein translocase subunit YajC n=1 Tax=Dehalobacter sp. DCM TaxID=2907827 RepID=UPI003081FBC5|nr:preprotein translocase subunit YajC [Dehalobacter sp. DCM]